jgi:hypothetical protein
MNKVLRPATVLVAALDHDLVVPMHGADGSLHVCIPLACSFHR